MSSVVLYLRVPELLKQTLADYVAAILKNPDLIDLFAAASGSPRRRPQRR